MVRWLAGPLVLGSYGALTVSQIWLELLKVRRRLEETMPAVSSAETHTQHCS